MLRSAAELTGVTLRAHVGETWACGRALGAMTTMGEPRSAGDATRLNSLRPGPALARPLALFVLAMTVAQALSPLANWLEGPSPAAGRVHA